MATHRAVLTDAYGLHAVLAEERNCCTSQTGHITLVVSHAMGVAVEFILCECQVQAGLEHVRIVNLRLCIERKRVPGNIASLCCLFKFFKGTGIRTDQLGLCTIESAKCDAGVFVTRLLT